MTVKKGESGRRSVQVEVEVPGSPEDVWQAIASGRISSWFVPTEVEQRDGGAILSHFGSGSSMDSNATIRLWDPPRRFVADSQDMGPEAPTIATEWIVEARSGDTCVVRVVHSWFASTDDWDSQFEQFEHGWPAFFRILRLYLAHFRGQTGAAFQLMGFAPEPTSEAWNSLTGSLGIAGADQGQRVDSSGDAPPLAGLVEQTGPPEHPELLLRLDQPAAGLAHLFAMPLGGQIVLPIRIYLYGESAQAVAAEAEPRWQAWMQQQFPSPA